MTLLEKALAVSLNRHSNAKKLKNGELDLCLAWIKGDITTIQVYRALWGDGGNNTASAKVLYRIATVMRIGVGQGLIKIEKTKRAA